MDRNTEIPKLDWRMKFGACYGLEEDEDKKRQECLSDGRGIRQSSRIVLGPLFMVSSFVVYLEVFCRSSCFVLRSNF